MAHHSKPITTDDPVFTDALDHFNFSDHSSSVSTYLSIQNFKHNTQDSVSNIPGTPESNPVPFSTGIRLRRLLSRQNSKHFSFKNSSQYFTHVNVTPTKGSKFLLNFKETHINSQLDKETNNDQSVTVDSVNSVSSDSNLIFTLMWLIMKLITSLKSSLFVGFVKFVTFPVWVTHSCCMFVTSPLAVMARAKGHVMRHVLRLLKLCLGYVYDKFVKRNKYVGRLCVQVGWGVLCATFVGLVLVCLLIVAFVVGGVVMRCVVEAPLSKIARLNFDYTRDAPMAFVPLMSCFGRDVKIGYGNVDVSRVVPLDRKLQATVSLTLPESVYNRNLGNFQVRVDYLSSNGKSIASATQPCTMRFKSRPIRLLMTLFNLVPLITGYSSESQIVDIKFNGYTEREIPTSCVKVVLEPRAEFAKGGGVPEIYTAYLKLESQLPLLKRVLWSWKATMFVWTSIAIFTLVLLFVLLCCAPWLRLRGDAPLSNTSSR